MDNALASFRVSALHNGAFSRPSEPFRRQANIGPATRKLRKRLRCDGKKSIV